MFDASKTAVVSAMVSEPGNARANKRGCLPGVAGVGRNPAFQQLVELARNDQVEELREKAANGVISDEEKRELASLLAGRARSGT